VRTTRDSGHVASGSADWLLIGLYIIAISLMITHGIDSTRFGEWLLLDLPVWLYVLSYLPFTAFLLVGIPLLALRDRRGYQLSVFVGFLVASTLVLHLPQLLGDTPLFHTALSVALILGSAVSGLVLAAAGVWRLRLR
jgi:hypothetical protein